MGAPVQMLWIGPRLSNLERLSMASFLANGHPVRLRLRDAQTALRRLANYVTAPVSRFA